MSKVYDFPSRCSGNGSGVVGIQEHLDDLQLSALELEVGAALEVTGQYKSVNAKVYRVGDGSSYHRIEVTATPTGNVARPRVSAQQLLTMSQMRSWESLKNGVINALYSKLAAAVVAVLNEQVSTPYSALDNLRGAPPRWCSGDGSGVLEGR